MNVEKHLPQGKHLCHFLMKKEVFPNLAFLKFRICFVLETIGSRDAKLYFVTTRPICTNGGGGVLVHLLCEKDNHSYIVEFMQVLLCVQNKIKPNIAHI